MHFSKYQALGNAYLVIAQTHADDSCLPDLAIRLSDFRLGIGSDGLLVGPLPSAVADFRLRIFNPDGSEAEKSGNGIRIFCQYLYDQGLVQAQRFSLETKGGIVSAQVFAERGEVQVAMGQVSFAAQQIPVAGPAREVLAEVISVANQSITINCATIGNPHCVVFCDEPNEALARRLGPLLEQHELFPNRSNVQFVKVLDRHTLQMEIWERGAGYTFASGSSSCAAAAVARKLNLVEAEVCVKMRGGEINIDVAHDYRVTMTGPVRKIAEGDLAC